MGGKLIYLSHTIPDISFAVGLVSRYKNQPTEDHQEAVFRILQYLKQNPGRGLFFGKTTDRQVKVFTDIDWGGSRTHGRSTTGYCSYVWGNLVTWRSKKQVVVARSSAEAEFRAMCHGICEGIWLRRLLTELDVTINSPITLLLTTKLQLISQGILCTMNELNMWNLTGTSLKKS